MTTVPPQLRPLLDQPLIAHLGTVRSDGAVQVNPMWFDFDGEHIRFTHTRARKKFANLAENPAMTIEILAPDNPYSYLELRGQLAEIVPDPEAEFYVELQRRYGVPNPAKSADAADRVILIMAIDRASGR